MRNKIITIIALLCITVLSLSGCIVQRVKPYPETCDEYFRYALYADAENKQIAFCIGFTELGAEQTHLILPSHINDSQIVGFGYTYSVTLWKTETVGNFKSDKLERIYIPFDIKGNPYIQDGCLNECPQCSLVLWRGENNVGGEPWQNIIYGYNSLKTYLKYTQFMGDPEIFDEELYGKYDKLANVSYMYNYNDTENEGCYWVDSYDEELIKFIPPTPTRDGYAFDGWYKEPECLNAWDFEKDKTKPEILIKYKNIGRYNTDDITFYMQNG